jgi:catechol 2,3-dioxygenase-like lactoylglutathione lyase family enzyme
MAGNSNAQAERAFSDGSSVDLFVGVPVTDLSVASAWYERVLGCPPAFLPNEKEAVWELAEHRYVFIELLPEHAGHGRHLIFLGDLDGFIAQIAARGLDPTKHETLANGVRKAIYSDPDGNTIECGGAPTKP